MRIHLLLFSLLITAMSFAQKSVSITKIIETDCNPYVKTVELYVDGTVDFSTEVQLNYMLNGGLWSDIQIDVSGFGTISNKFIYIVRDVSYMQAEFPNTLFETDSSLTGFNTIVTTTSTNGNDGYQVVLNGVVVSQFGKTDTDADVDTIWEHDDSVVTRKQNIVDDGTWNETHWDYSGKNSLDGETFCKGGNGVESFLGNLGGDYPLQYGPGNGGSSNNFTLLPNTTGSFTFYPQAPVNRASIKVFYHIPSGDITKMPILMSFHGSGRDGGPHRDYWIQMANDNGFMVIAPEFSSSNYPGLGDNYLMSNIFDDGDNPSPSTFNDKNDWTFSTLDPLFEAVKKAVSGTQEKYNAWGHSGGAQFLHRFVTYLPNSKLNIAVCSNAGWYTVPETIVSFPYGILNGQLPNTDLTTAFSRKLIVHLGQDDNNPNSAGLRHNAVVDAQQGMHRLERGRYYFNTSETTAQNMGTTFNWELHELASVGHDAQLMANDALQFMLSSLLSVNEFKDSDAIKMYPNPVENVLFFDNSKVKSESAILYAITGKKVALFNFKDFSLNQEINVSNLSKGIYFLKIRNATIKIVKK